jgi:hypothetical protein
MRIRKKDLKVFVMIRNISKYPNYLRRHYWCCSVFSTATKFTLLNTYLKKTTYKIHKVVCEKGKQFADLYVLSNKGQIYALSRHWVTTTQDTDVCPSAFHTFCLFAIYVKRNSKWAESSCCCKADVFQTYRRGIKSCLWLRTDDKADTKARN